MRVAVNDVELEVDVRGDGPPVLLVHGWPDDHHLWDAQADALVAAGYRTIAPDLRGFGASSSCHMSYSERSASGAKAAQVGRRACTPPGRLRRWRS